MSFTLYATPFIDGTTRVPAAWLNKVRSDTSQAIDGAGGGAYTPTAVIDIGGTFGLKLSATGATAQWLQLGSRTVTINHPLSLATVVTGVGPGNNVDSAVIQESDLTTSIGGLTVASPCVASPTGALNAGDASYYILELVRPPDASTLVSVTITTKGAEIFGTVPTYTLVKWSGITSGPTAISTVDQVDTHVIGDWTTSIIAQTIAANAATTIDISAAHYGVLVKNPYQAGGSHFFIYTISASYTVTSMRY